MSSLDMKKLFILIILICFWVNISFANEQVYYCVDDRVAGFESSKIGDKGRAVNFQPSKFKVQINGATSSMKVIEGGNDRDFKTYNKYKFFYTNNFDETIVFQPKSWEKDDNIKHYVRSHTLPGDSLYVSQGKCEKF